MSDTQLYKAQLLEHFKRPRNKAAGDLSHMQFIKRGSNPSCGDDIEIGFNVVENAIQRIEFRGRGCSVCIASASMMTEALQGLNVSDADALSHDVHQWIAGEREYIPETLAALDAVRHHPVRKKCLMLCWRAFAEGLEECHA
jgi:nitrogen fixation NifU-like protein